MNKILSIIVILFALLVLSAVLQLFISTSRADHLAQELPTQKNKQTDLFDKSVDNLSDFTGKLEAGKQGGIDSMGGEHGNPQGLQYITKKSKGELGGESGKLESIGENDLASRGREEMIKKDSLNELYTDYSRPLNKQHLKDAKTIANAQDELLKNLLEKLKDLGVDCKTIKGDKKIEPEYFLQTKNTTHKDTIYNQTFCEELRNNYNCNDTATLTCAKIVKKFKNPEARKIKLDGHWLHHNTNDWGWAVQWETKRWGWHIHSHRPKGGFALLKSPSGSIWQGNPKAIIADARAYIANHLGVPIEQIGEHVEFPPGGMGIGNINPVGCRWRVAWDWYEFGYTYREVYHVCEQWAEDWTERCTIK
jgi:hypothetical protein